MNEEIDLGNQFKQIHCDKMKCSHVPVEQLLRLGMDGEDRSCGADDLLPACDASVAVSEASDAEGEFCFGGDSEPWRL